MENKDYCHDHYYNKKDCKCSGLVDDINRFIDKLNKIKDICNKRCNILEFSAVEKKMALEILEVINDK